MSEMYPYVCFVGQWTPRQQRMLQRTVRIVDDHLDLRPVTRKLGATWICQHVTDASSLYVASRLHLNSVIVAYSPWELRMRLLERAGAITTFRASRPDRHASADPAPSHLEPKPGSGEADDHH